MTHITNHNNTKVNITANVVIIQYNVGSGDFSETKLVAIEEHLSGNLTYVIMFSFRTNSFRTKPNKRTNNKSPYKQI